MRGWNGEFASLNIKSLRDLKGCFRERRGYAFVFQIISYLWGVARPAAYGKWSDSGTTAGLAPPKKPKIIINTRNRINNHANTDLFTLLFCGLVPPPLSLRSSARSATPFGRACIRNTSAPVEASPAGRPLRCINTQPSPRSGERAPDPPQNHFPPPTRKTSVLLYIPRSF